MRILAFFAIFYFSILAEAKTVVFTVEGVEGKNAKIVRDLISKKLTQNYTLDQLQDTLGTIYNLGIFSDAEVDIDERDDKTDIIFKVTPVRIIKTIRLVNAPSFAKSDLLTELGMGNGEVYNSEKVKGGIENVKKYYNLNGFLNAQVKGQFTQLGASDLTLDVIVDEGSPCVISGFEFKSLNSKLNQSLQKFLAKRKGVVFTQPLLTQMQNDLSDELFKQHFYSSTLQAPEINYDPLKTKVNLAYTILDPYSYVLVFEGNQTFTEVKIRNQLNLESTRLSTSPTDEISDRLIRFYKRSGYADVSVRTKQTLFSQDYIRRVTFMIKEGAKVKIKDIHIEGNFSRPEKFYQKFLFDRSGDIIYGHVYDAEDFESGTKNLVTELQNQGFIGAKITGTRIDFSKRRDSVSITVVLDEGPQTLIDKVSFRGAKSVPESDLEKAIGIKPGDPLQLKAVEESATRLVDLYRSQGYLDARVTNQGKSIISYSPDNAKAYLDFEVDEGPQITVAAILIDGNTFTKEEVIRRELQFHPGEVLTPEKLGYTEQKLQRLSLFSAVDIRTLENDPTQGNRTVLVHVEERPPGIFRAGAGVNNDEGFTIRGFVGAGYRNLFGTGRGINGRVEVDDKTQYQFLENEVTLGYTEPFIFGTENTARLNLIRSRRLYAVSNTLPTNMTSNNGAVGPFDFAVDSSQADTAIERDLSSQLKLVYEVYGIAHINQFEINNKVNLAPLDIATTGPTLVLDRRDDPFNPKHGDISSLSLEFSSPYMGSTSTVGYYKSVADYKLYLPLFGMTLATEAKGGYAANLSPASGSAIPALKGFILGGESSLRAFNFLTESVPLVTEFPTIGNLPVVPTETFFGLARAELRFNIIGNFDGAVFYDGGAVSFPGYHPHYSWRDNVGVGLRYNTAVGPVSLEYAQKLNEDADRGEGLNQVLFSIGVF